MLSAAEVRVVRRNLRWEVSVAGRTRPLIDWLCTKDRAIDHAFQYAREIGVDAIVVETADGSLEERLSVPRVANVHNAAFGT